MNNDIDVNIAAGRWELKPGTVRNYCSNGLIPGALKINGKWKIPCDAIKPLSSEKLKQLLRLINMLKHYPDLDIDYCVTGLSDRNITRVFEHLVLLGVAQKFDTKEQAERIPHILKLTQRGLDIIESSKTSKNNIDKEAVIKIGLTAFVEVAAAIINAVA